VARRLTLLVVLAALCAVSAGSASAAIDGERSPRELTTSSCNVVKVGDRAFVMYRRGVACTWSKRWVRRLAASQGRNKPRGFSCSSGSKFRGGGYCERGSKHFGWHGGE
jgi:hypothetical protein